jgi:hypothetical protein
MLVVLAAISTKREEAAPRFRLLLWGSATKLRSWFVLKNTFEGSNITLRMALQQTALNGLGK